jgi:hypothetical protein
MRSAPREFEDDSSGKTRKAPCVLNHEVFCLGDKLVQPGALCGGNRSLRVLFEERIQLSLLGSRESVELWGRSLLYGHST